MFIAQLHRRARLLNTGFQASVAEVIRRRQASEAIVTAEVDLDRFFEEDETSSNGPPLPCLLSKNSCGGVQGGWEHGAVGIVHPDCGQLLSATVVFPEATSPSRLESRSSYLDPQLRKVSEICSSFESPPPADWDRTSRLSRRPASNRPSCNAATQQPIGSDNSRDARRRSLSPSRLTRKGSFHPDLGPSKHDEQQHCCSDATKELRRGSGAESCSRRSESPSRRARPNPLQRDFLGSGMSSGWAPIRSTSYESEPTRGSKSHTVSVVGLAAVEVRCVFAGGAESEVNVCPAPTKSVARMREKLAEYAAEGAAWPLTAQILDPVRASVVCQGPAEMLEVAQWFMEDGRPGGGECHALLPVCRVKNKFALKKDELVSSVASVDKIGWLLLPQMRAAGDLSFPRGSIHTCARTRFLSAAMMQT